jgi:hypothetical protein
MHRRIRQLHWLLRRLSRTTAGEWPYRVQGLASVLLMRAGIGTAQSVSTPSPAPDPFYWIHLPKSRRMPAKLAARVFHTLQGDLTVLGVPVHLADPPEWNRDPLTGSNLHGGFGPMIDFRHLAANVDIKYLWELNRHLWLVCLAQAVAVCGHASALAFLRRALQSWLDQCPYLAGPNWSSPVEHGIRLINWSIVWQLCGGEQGALFAGPDGTKLRNMWLRSIFQHMHFIAHNYSKYSSADNHLIGEAAGMFVAASTWPRWAECEAWQKHARQLLEQEIQRQFSADGVNLEQAFCYQKFAMEFLLAAGLCARARHADFSETYWQRIGAAGRFVASVLPAQAGMPAIGDGDDSRVMGLAFDDDACPYRSLVTLIGRATAQPDLSDRELDDDGQLDWLYPRPPLRIETLAVVPLPRYFPHGGYAVLGSKFDTRRETRLLFDIGNLGLNRVAGHGHADALALTLHHHGKALLIDSGTYCYNLAPAFRAYFRGTTAHNTAAVDGLDQACYGGSFLWLSDINTKVEECVVSEKFDRIRASHDGYMRLSDPVRHVREIRFDKDKALIHVEDRLECRNSHNIAIYWHFHPDCSMEIQPRGVLIRNGDTGLLLRCVGSALQFNPLQIEPGTPTGWVSTRFGVLEQAPGVVLAGTVNCHDRIVTSIQLFP